MLASVQKLAVNNLCLISEVLDGVRIIRENGGYGTIELKVKDGLVLAVKAMVERHINP